MQITYCNGYGEMSHVAVALVREALKEKPNLLLCAATGSSPEGLYKELTSTAGARKELFPKVGDWLRQRNNG